MNNRLLIRFNIEIRETRRNHNVKNGFLKVAIPLDSKKKKVFKQSTRAVRDLLYFLFEQGYTNPVRIHKDAFWYDAYKPWNQQTLTLDEEEE